MEQSESNYDYFNVYASINNSNFYGWKRSGNSNGWVSASFDLTNVYILGNLVGQSQVWIAFNFTSDGSTTAEGAFVDDIILRKYLVSNDPTNLVAGSNFKNLITLNWRAPSSAMRALDNSPANISSERYSGGLAIDYYNVYRKVTSSGSYTLIGTTVRRDYIDNNVTQGTIYYYKISAVIGGVESGFSNESSASCNSTGYTFNLPTSTVAPTINGFINTSEWADAYILNITNVLGVSNDPPNQNVFAYLKRVGNYLYLAVKDIGDIADNTWDQIGFYFDNNNNNQWDVGEGNIWLTRTTTSIGISFREITGTYPNSPQFGTPVDNPVGVAGAIAMNAGHMEYEIRFDMTASPFRPAGSSFGFFVYSLDGNRDQYTGRYPNAVVWTAPVSYTDVNISPTSIKDKLFSSIPDIYKLYQNTPNPFNPSTTIQYALPANSTVRLTIFNTLGQQVALLINEQQNAGWHRVEWKANVTSGLYYYRIEATDVNNPNNRFVETRKMLLLR